MIVLTGSLTGPHIGGGIHTCSCASAGCHTKYGNHAEVAHASTAGTGRHASIQYQINHGPINYDNNIIHVFYKGRLYYEIRISPLISGILKDTYLTVFL